MDQKALVQGKEDMIIKSEFSEHLFSSQNMEPFKKPS